MNRPQEVKLHFLDYWRIVRIRLGLIFLIFVVVLGTTAVVTYLQPREYSSFATIELRPDMTPVRIFENEPVASERTGFDPKFTPTQFQIITRKGVLYPVIEQLELDKKWGSIGQPMPKEFAYSKLEQMLSLQEIRNTNLIQITVFSVDPAEAALLANTIAQVYMDQRISERRDLVTKGLEQLRDEVTKKEQEVNQAYAEASKLRTESGVVDPNPDSLENSTRVEDSSVMANQAKVDEAQSQVATLSSRVERLDELKREDLMRAAGLLKLDDPIIEQKLPAYQTAQTEKARLLNSGLGRNHPDVKAIQAQIDLLQQQLGQQIDSIRKGLTTQLAIAQSSLKAMQNNLGLTLNQQQEKKTASVRYLDAKYRYVQERKLLEAAKTRLNTETMERTMPQQSAAIRDVAEPGHFPTKPKVFLNLVLGALAGLALGVGLAFFLEYLDTSLKSMDDIENCLGLPVLAVIPKGTKLLTSVDADSADGEAYRLLGTGLESRQNNLVARAISVVSGGASEGKSTTTCNLAITFALAGQRVLVVDADMRRSTLHQLLNVERRPGLADYLSGDAELDQTIKPASIENLFLLPSGSSGSNVVSLLKSTRMSEFVKIARQQFDVVLFDCTPLLGVSDASIVAKLTDACLLVVQHRRFPRSMLLRVKQMLEAFGVTVLGVVLNNVDVRHDPHYQFYTSYREYYGKPRQRQKSRGMLENAGAKASIGNDR